jgi:type VI secretion system protein ImpK
MPIASETTTSKRQENLALVFQEILTAIERLRSNRQAVSDSESFRAQIQNAVKAADQEGRKRGYAPEDIRVALFAVIALLDESILNLHNPLFASWPRRPMQEELFGGFTAGEIFFQNIERLLRTNDSDVLADVLEVYEICILLGYLGRYSISGRGELKSIREAIAEKIYRIRGNLGPLSPAGKPPSGETPKLRSDIWVTRLLWAAVACFALMMILFVGFKVSLHSGAGRLESLATRNL